jgi:hypothetical protein
VVWLRLFEQQTMEQVASQLNIGVAAARRRFHKGAELYRRRLAAEVVSRSQASALGVAEPPEISVEIAPVRAADSSSD